MPSYVEKNLIKGENIIYKSPISVWPYMLGIVFGVILIPFMGIGVLILGALYFSRKSHEVVITNKRVISKSGLVWRKTIEMNLRKIESLQVDQGIFGRMLNYGSLVLSGAGNPLEKTPAIKSPMEFRRLFLETQDVVMNSSSQDIPIKSYKAKVRLNGNATTDAEVQGYTRDTAKAALEAKYGKGSLIGELAEI